MINNREIFKWEARRKAQDAIRAKGECWITYKLRRVNVVCPYNEDFVTGAKAIGGDWRYKSEIWSFRSASSKLVLQLAHEVFGVKKVYFTQGGR